MTPATRLAATALLSCAVVTHAATVDGQLDATFGTNGVAVIGGVASADFQPGPIFAATSDGAGRILVAGTGDRMGAAVLFVVRLLANGDVDPAFGSQGVTTLPSPDQGTFFFPVEHGMNVVVEASGRIVVAAWLNNATDTMGQYLFALDGTGALIANYGPNGAPGFVDFGSFSPYQNLGSRNACSLARGLDGALYVASWVDYTEPSPVALGRLTSDGRLDASFGAGGKVQINGLCDSMVIQPDGKFLFTTIGGTPFNLSSGLLRYQSDGQPDTQFGINGVVFIDFELQYDEPLSIALDGDSIYLGSYAGGPDMSACYVCIARFTSSGALDTTFNAAGRSPGFPGVARLRPGSGDHPRQLFAGFAGGVVMTGSVAAANLDFGGTSALASGARNTQFTSDEGVGVFHHDIGGADDYVARSGAFLDEARRLVLFGNTPTGPVAIRVLNDTISLDGVED